MLFCLTDTEVPGDQNGAPEMTHTPYCKDFPYNTVNIGYKRIYVLLKSAYIQLIRVRLCIRFSVPVKRGRQEAIRGTRGYIGMGEYFEGFGGCLLDQLQH